MMNWRTFAERIDNKSPSIFSLSSKRRSAYADNTNGDAVSEKDRMLQEKEAEVGATGPVIPVGMSKPFSFLTSF